MRRFILAVIAGATATLCCGGLAQAQRYTNYRFCAIYDQYTTTSCAFDTWQQCMATVSGRGGFCEPNPYYAPPRARRRH